MGHLSDFLDLLKGTNVDDSIRGKYEGVARKKILFMVLLIVALVVVSIGVLGVGGVMVDFGNVFRVLFHPIFPDHVSAPDQLYYSVKQLPLRPYSHEVNQEGYVHFPHNSVSSFWLLSRLTSMLLWPYP